MSAGAKTSGNAADQEEQRLTNISRAGVVDGLQRESVVRIVAERVVRSARQSGKEISVGAEVEENDLVVIEHGDQGSEPLVGGGVNGAEKSSLTGEEAVRGTK